MSVLRGILHDQVDEAADERRHQQVAHPGHQPDVEHQADQQDRRRPEQPDPRQQPVRRQPGQRRRRGRHEARPRARPRSASRFGSARARAAAGTAAAARRCRPRRTPACRRARHAGSSGRLVVQLDPLAVVLDDGAPGVLVAVALHGTERTPVAERARVWPTGSPVGRWRQVLGRSAGCSTGSSSGWPSDRCCGWSSARRSPAPSTCRRRARRSWPATTCRTPTGCSCR